MTSPSNDAFAGAIALAGPSITGSTIGATPEAGEPAPVNGNEPSASVWYSWKAPTTEQYVVWVESYWPQYNSPCLDVFTGASLATLVPIDGYNRNIYRTGLESDWQNSSNVAQMVEATAGVTYWFRVSGYVNDSFNVGTFTLRLMATAAGYSNWQALVLRHPGIYPLTSYVPTRGPIPTFQRSATVNGELYHQGDYDAMRAIAVDPSWGGRTDTLVQRGGDSSFPAANFSVRQDADAGDGSVTTMYNISDAKATWSVEGVKTWRPTSLDPLAPTLPTGGTSDVEWEAGPNVIQSGGGISLYGSLVIAANVGRVGGAGALGPDVPHDAFTATGKLFLSPPSDAIRVDWDSSLVNTDGPFLGGTLDHWEDGTLLATMQASGDSYSLSLLDGTVLNGPSAAVEFEADIGSAVFVKANGIGYVNLVGRSGFLDAPAAFLGDGVAIDSRLIFGAALRFDLLMPRSRSFTWISSPPPPVDPGEPINAFINGELADLRRTFY